MGTNPRLRQYRARMTLRERVKLEGRPCGICGKSIDYNLPAGHEQAFELDEILPVSKGGSPVDYRNVQPSHRVCNRRKGNRTSAPHMGAPAPKNQNLPTSRDWKM